MWIVSVQMCHISWESHYYYSEGTLYRISIRKTILPVEGYLIARERLFTVCRWIQFRDSWQTQWTRVLYRRFVILTFPIEMVFGMLARAEFFPLPWHHLHNDSVCVKWRIAKLPQISYFVSFALLKLELDIFNPTKRRIIQIEKRKRYIYFWIYVIAI